MYLCGSKKHNCQPFCGPEGRFDYSNCSLRPAPFSYLCVQLRILGVLKIVCCCRIKPGCHLPTVVSIFTDSAACVLSCYLPPLHYNTKVEKHEMQPVTTPPLVWKDPVSTVPNHERATYLPQPGRRHALHKWWQCQTFLCMPGNALVWAWFVDSCPACVESHFVCSCLRLRNLFSGSVLYYF